MSINKDNSNIKDSDEIQAQITMLMGLPAKEAEARLNKFDKPNINSKRVNKEVSEPNQTTTKEPAINNADLESPDTDLAVQEILHEEADKMLVQQDENIQKYQIKPKVKNPFLRGLNYWWSNKKLRNTSIAILTVIIVSVVAIPTSRYAILNTVGVKSEMSFIVVDKVSGKPVKNVNVIIGDIQAKSNENGNVIFSDLKLGPSEIKISKRSFKEITIPVVVGWGSNPFGDPIEIEPTGTSFNFTVNNWLDDLAIKGAEVTDGESVAVADESGKATLTIEPTDEDIKITLKAKGYRDENIVIPADVALPQSVKMVADTKDVFISKRSGKYDLYVRDIDGKNEILVLPATGNEQDDTDVLGGSDQKNVALVSSRDGQRNDSGYIMSNLYIVDIKSKTATKVEGTQSEKLELIDWVDNKIIFVKTIAGPSASIGNRQRLISYDVKTNNTKELATADYFSDVRVYDSQVYYVVANSGKGSQPVGLAKIDPTGDNRKNLLASNVWSLYRIEPNSIVISSSEDKWYNISLDNDKVNSIEGPPAQLKDIKFAANSDRTKFAKIEERDGKSVIIILDKETNKEVEITRKSGINTPLTWVNDQAIMYTINNSDETARYVVSINKPEKFIKIGDISTNRYRNSFY